jgi:hypothetical protein
VLSVAPVIDLIAFYKHLLPIFHFDSKKMLTKKMMKYLYVGKNQYIESLLIFL